ncbi:MAG: dihydrofolate reductase [Limnohabitans sp.]|nr:dihydrofolate reductase [Limnohabitans sp.]
MPINLIFARARNGVIGKDNQLPWHLPEDLAHFKRTTLGQPVIMGRKTWDSLPPKFRPLPGRANLVVTRQTDWQASGATVAHSLAQAQSMCDPAQEVWVIGGAEIYAQALPYARKAVITEIDITVDGGDAFAPQFGPQWQETAREEHVSAQGLPYRFITLEHKGD